MKKISLIILALFTVIFCKGQKVQASDFNNEDNLIDITQDYDYDEIQKVLDDTMTGQNKFQFGNYVRQIASGERQISVKGILGDIAEGVHSEFSENIKILLTLISVAIAAAVFTNFTNVFNNTQVAETGFYVVYLLLFTLLTSSFFTVAKIAGSTIGSVLDFMKALVPTYFLSVAFCSGSVTSITFYEASLVLISIVNILIIKIILPAINMYMLILLANNFSKDDKLSKFAELLQTGIKWTLKSLIGAVIGFHTMQGIIVPIAENVKKSAVLKVSKAIPGVGEAIGSVTETVLGAGVLVKNAIGAGGLVVIITICIIPLIKLLLYTVILKIGVAAIQPVSDKRIINCIGAAEESGRLLIYTVFIGGVTFFITIAMVAASTNLNLK